MAERDGRWFAGLTPATAAVAEVAEASRDLQVQLAHRMGLNVTDMAALRLLDVHGPMGPTELATLLQIRTPSVTVLLDRLERAGHLHRSPSEADRRRVLVHADPQAVALSDQVWEPVVRAMDQVARDLSPADQQVVSDYLHRLAAVIATLAHPEPDQ